MPARRPIAVPSFALMLALGPIIAGCTSPTAGSGGGPAGELTLGESQSGMSVVIAAGGSLTLELPVTSGTGYGWDIRVDPQDLLRVPAEPLTIRGDAAMPGSVTQQRWVLTEARAGRGTVEAVYRRPWETDVPPAKRFSVAVRVENAEVPSRNP
jgi:inhibitor of cysteine peptidase